MPKPSDLIVLESLLTVARAIASANPELREAAMRRAAIIEEEIEKNKNNATQAA